MKKNKTKIIITIAIICVIIGSVLLGAGLAMGGDIQTLHIGKDNTSWWPFEGSLGINVSEENEYTDNSRNTWEMPLNKDTQLSIEMDLGDIRIKEGNESKIKFYNIKESEVTTKLDGNEKEIKIRRPGIHHNVKNARMEITLRKDAVYNLEVDNKLGDININDLNFRKLDIEANMGDITLQDIHSKQTDVNNDCGDIKMFGVYEGETSVENKLGDIKMEITGNKNTFDFDIENKLGDTLIQDQNYEFKSKIKEKHGNANRLEIDCHLGDIKVHFR